MGTTLPPATQALLQELPALQHFLHTPKAMKPPWRSQVWVSVPTQPLLPWHNTQPSTVPPLGNSSRGSRTTKRRKTKCLS